MKLPAAWEEAYRRDAERKPELADPLPERRLARLLAAFLATGIVFLVAPGTLLGVWNLIGISSRRSAESISPVWIQGHGHAQLFGWVATFIIGISLYSLPKFRGGALRSLGAGWATWALWTAAVSARWGAALLDWHWRMVWPIASAAELVVALLLIWQCSAPGRNRGLWNRLIFAGFAGLVITLAWQLAALFPMPVQPLLSEAADRAVLWLALWLFAFPVVWGFSARFLPAFLGLDAPSVRAVNLGLMLLAAAAVMQHRISAALLVGAALAACWSLRLFTPPPRKAKVAGVDPRYPWFVRISYGWLVMAAVLGCVAESRGWVGASRHAFTVGFLATLIFAMGPRLLPSFVNSRELWSKRLMLAALVLLTAGCALRVGSEPLAYSGSAPFAWKLLPISAIIELTAVLAFALNLGVTLARPFPAWIALDGVTADLPLYWYVSAYPRTRRIMERAGLATLARVRRVPQSLTLRAAAAADHADVDRIVGELRAYFERNLARTLKEKQQAC
jgi:uncharacterized protein involved in response to NO